MVDTSVLVAGLVWPRWPYEVLRHALREDFRLVLAPVIVAESRRIITRKFPNFLARIDDFLLRWPYELQRDPTPQDVMAHQTLLRDRNDIPIALAAIQAQVDCFVSEDKHFTQHTPATAELHRRLPVLLSGIFLRVHMGWSSRALDAVRKRSWMEIDSAAPGHS